MTKRVGRALLDFERNDECSVLEQDAQDPSTDCYCQARQPERFVLYYKRGPGLYRPQSELWDTQIDRRRVVKSFLEGGRVNSTKRGLSVLVWCEDV